MGAIPAMVFTLLARPLPANTRRPAASCTSTHESAEKLKRKSRAGRIRRRAAASGVAGARPRRRRRGAAAAAACAGGRRRRRSGRIVRSARHGIGGELGRVRVRARRFGCAVGGCASATDAASAESCSRRGSAGAARALMPGLPPKHAADEQLRSARRARELRPRQVCSRRAHRCAA